jgi:hypothetical protein
VATAGGVPREAATQPSQTRVLTVDIPGAPHASAHVHDIALDDLIVDAAGEARFGEARLAVSGSPEAVKELFAWFRLPAQDPEVRRTIKVALGPHDQSPPRTYNLVDCFPLSFSGGDFTVGAESNLAELRVQPTRVDLG